MLPLIIEIPKFVRKIQLSESQRIKHFEWNGKEIKAKGVKLPKKFIDLTTFNDIEVFNPLIQIENLKSNYVLGFLKNGKIKHHCYYTNELLSDKKGKYILCEIIDKIPTPIIANSKNAGTPKMYVINGQDIYNGTLNPFTRGKVMDSIKDNYKEYLKGILPITEYPVTIEVELHDTIKNPYHKHKDEIGHRWDIDNYIYPYMKAFPDVLTELKILKDDDRLYLTQPPAPKFFPVNKHEDRKLVFIIKKDERPEIINNEVYKCYHKNKETYETEDLDLINKDEPFEE